MMLEVSRLNVAIKSKTILKAMNFNASPGWFGILGVNGSGKTTLLKALCARLAIASGKITWRGADITSDESVRAQAFGFAAPLDSLPQTVTAGELIALVADLRGCGAHQPQGIYTALGLVALRNKPIGSMSSGMKQRVSVFCAFLGEPDLVLLDEPFNWLDPVAAYDLKREIRAYADDRRCVITALHDVETFVTRCDSGILIHDGEVLRTFNAERMADGRRDPLALEEEVYRLFPREVVS